jgi:hypothetical protein
MATQTNLDLIWASTGGVTDPGDTKYQTGWISEIPTFQNFNFVLQNHSTNLLALAESGRFNWQTEISYVAGTEVLEAGKKYFCIANNSGQQPSLDTLNNFWIPGTVIGDALATAGGIESGVLIQDVSKQVLGSWDGNDITIKSVQPLISLISNGAGKNWLFGTISGEMVMIDVDTVANPDSRNINLGQAGVYRVYHEGHKPDQTEISGTIPDSPQDGKLYARSNGNWVEVTSTTVSAAPPPAVAGAGQGWYNLDDGQFYLDINDGDSSQWVPANPPVIPQVDAVDVDFDNTNVIGNATTVQEELELIDGAMHRKNMFINGDFRIAQRGETTSVQGYGSVDRVFYNSSGGTGSLNRVALATDGSDVASTRYAVELDATVGADFMAAISRLELLRETAGKTITVSFDYKLTGKALNNRISQSEDTNDTIPASTQFSKAIPVSATWTTFSHTLTLDALPAAFVGSANEHLRLVIAEQAEFDVTTDAFNFQATNVQVEFGSEATPFEIRPIGEEWSLCQRYFFRALGLSRAMTAFHAGSTRVGTGTLPHPTEMRAAPSITFDSLPTVRIVSTTSAGTTTTTSVTSNTTSFSFECIGSYTNPAYVVIPGYEVDAEL